MLTTKQWMNVKIGDIFDVHSLYLHNDQSLGRRVQLQVQGIHANGFVRVDILLDGEHNRTEQMDPETFRHIVKG